MGMLSGAGKELTDAYPIVFHPGDERGTVKITVPLTDKIVQSNGLSTLKFNFANEKDKKPQKLGDLVRIHVT